MLFGQKWRLEAITAKSEENGLCLKFNFTSSRVSRNVLGGLLAPYLGTPYFQKSEFPNVLRFWQYFPVSVCQSGPENINHLFVPFFKTWSFLRAGVADSILLSRLQYLASHHFHVFHKTPGDCLMVFSLGHWWQWFDIRCEDDIVGDFSHCFHKVLIMFLAGFDVKSLSSMYLDTQPPPGTLT